MKASRARPFGEAGTSEKNRVSIQALAEGARGLEHIFGLIDGEDIRQALCLRRLEQVHMHPWLVQDMRIEKLQPVQVELDRAP